MSAEEKQIYKSIKEHLKKGKFTFVKANRSINFCDKKISCLSNLCNDLDYHEYYPINENLEIVLNVRDRDIENNKAFSLIGKLTFDIKNQISWVYFFNKSHKRFQPLYLKLNFFQRYKLAYILKKSYKKREQLESMNIQQESVKDFFKSNKVFARNVRIKNIINEKEEEKAKEKEENN